MAFTLLELNPINPVLTVDGREFELSKLTLKHENLFADAFGSLQELYAKASKEYELIIKALWLLLIDKSQFNNTYSLFLKHILTAKEFPNLSDPLDDAVTRSRPVVKNQKRLKEINAIKQNESGEKPCYATYFDSIAKRYGYTLDEFMALTLGQLHMMLNKIGDESYKELEVQAALMGKKLKPRIKYNDISEEEEKEQDAQAMDALRRLRERYEQNQGKIKDGG